MCIMLSKRSRVLLKYTPDSYNPSHTVLYPHARSYKKFGYNELGCNEQSILRSLPDRYNEILLLSQKITRLGRTDKLFF